MTNLRRSIDRWRACDPKAIAAGSEAQCMYALDDARADILALAAALSRQAPAAPAEAERVYLVATGETVGGLETYTRHKGAPPPLSDYERLYAAPTAAAPTQALLGWTRYEKARKLNVAQWAELHQRNLRGENFDDMIDALPATTQPVQQDTKGGVVDFFRDPLDLVKTIALALERGYEAADILDENSPIRDRIRLIAKGVPTHDELAQRETEGWKLVPVQPTTEMINAGQCGCMDNDVTACIYQKMLDATPPAEKQAAPSGEDNHG